MLFADQLENFKPFGSVATAPCLCRCLWNYFHSQDRKVIMPEWFPWAFQNFLWIPTAESPTLLPADPRTDIYLTPEKSRKTRKCTLTATHSQLTMTAEGEWCQGRGMCDGVLWRCTVCVCACVSDGARGGEGLCVAKQWKDKVREKWCLPKRITGTMEKCRVRRGRREEGRQWLGVVNDFARRSQTALTWLGGVRIDASLCQALTNQPCALKMKKKKSFTSIAAACLGGGWTCMQNLTRTGSQWN